MRIALRIALALVFLGGAAWVFGPYEPAGLEARHDPAAIGEDLDAYLAASEAAFDDITPGVEKRVVWAEGPGTRTPLSLLYVHGFSATSEEIRPIPDRLAEAFGANLVYTRLAGHGRSGAAMGEARAADWMRDLSEALDIAGRVGERVVVISTSTGGTLVTAAAHDPDLMQNVAGLIFVAPNYGVNSPIAGLLDWPAARYWVPLLAGAERNFEPANEAHGTYWTTTYPSVAVMPMAALIREVAKLDHGRVAVPALFHYHNDDQVVRADLTEAVAASWGAPATVTHPELTEADDSYAHVIAGEILSPNQTEPTVETFRQWIADLP